VYTVNEETKQAIEKSTGLPYDEIIRISPEQRNEYVKREHRDITFPNEVDPRKMPRGNVLLGQGKIITREDVEKKFKKIKGAK